MQQYSWHAMNPYDGGLDRMQNLHIGQWQVVEPGPLTWASGADMPSCCTRSVSTSASAASARAAAAAASARAVLASSSRSASVPSYRVLSDAIACRHLVNVRPGVRNAEEREQHAFRECVPISGWYWLSKDVASQLCRCTANLQCTGCVCKCSSTTKPNSCLRCCQEPARLPSTFTCSC